MNIFGKRIQPIKVASFAIKKETASTLFYENPISDIIFLSFLFSLSLPILIIIYH